VPTNGGPRTASGRSTTGVAGNRRREVDRGLHDANRDAVGDRTRQGIARFKRHVQEQYAELADAEIRRFRAASAADRETLGKAVTVEAEQQLAGRLVQNLDLLELERAAGRVGDAQLVDQVTPTIGTRDRIGRPQGIGEERRELGLRRQDRHQRPRPATRQGGRRARASDFVHAERLAHGLHALLVRRPQAAADHAAIDHQVVAVDEARFVGGQEHGGVGDVVDAAGAAGSAAAWP
jgi:hypothetical protein